MAIVFALTVNEMVTNGESSSDPGMGVVRHADAGHDSAIQTAKEKNVHIPMLNKKG